MVRKDFIILIKRKKKLSNTLDNAPDEFTVIKFFLIGLVS